MKKKIYISITMILLLALCISLCVCLTGCVNSSEKIKLGYTHDEVRKVMGDPYEEFSSDSTWCYFGSSYTNLLNQIEKNEEEQAEALLKGDSKRLNDLINKEAELQAKLETTVYEYTEITFVRDEAKGYIVNSVMFDKNRRNSSPTEKKEVKNVEVEGTVKVKVDGITDKTGDTEKAIYTDNIETSGDAYYTAHYTDGSYCLAYLLPNIEAVKTTAGTAKITWSDSLGTYETNADITVNEVGEIDKDGKFVTYQNFNRDLTEFTIPNSVTSIGDQAFDGCANLTSITIPNSVTSIGEEAFDGCDSLESITLPFVGATLNGDEDTHFGYIFGGNSSVPASLKEVVITGGSNIGSEAFKGCANIESITIPNSVTSIGDNAFEGCDSLNYNRDDNADYLGNDTNPYLVLVKAKNADISTCEINSETRLICNYAFSGCTNIESITIPSGVTSIGYGAFSDCDGLESITLPFVGATLNGDENTHFDYIFGAESYNDGTDNYSPTYLTEVTITGGNSIDDHAFQYCYRLKNITISNSVTRIGYEAFFFCDSLESFTMGDSVTSIGESAFV